MIAVSGNENESETVVGVIEIEKGIGTEIGVTTVDVAVLVTIETVDMVVVVAVGAQVETVDIDMIVEIGEEEEIVTASGTDVHATEAPKAEALVPEIAVSV